MKLYSMRFVVFREVVVAFLGVMFFAPRLAAQTGFCVMEWNVENLFDPYDDPQKQDDEFTPTAVRRWTWHKFMKKLENVGKTIAAAGGVAVPDLVALCEVENDTVLEKLTKVSVLKRAGYRYFVTSSLDSRGINVALLYRPLSFAPVCTEIIRPNFNGLPRKFSRDVLLVSGRVVTGDTLDVFVCHFPSRLDRYKQGARYRERLARQVGRKADSLFKVRRHANVIITGDFNDVPQSPLLCRHLGARPVLQDSSEFRDDRLFNLMYSSRGDGSVKGTYCYKGKWETIDNFVVSGRLLRKSSPLSLSRDGCRIFAAPFLFVEKDGAKVPFRTYNGMRYLGGFSDHLPLVARFSFSW